MIVTRIPGTNSFLSASDLLTSLAAGKRLVFLLPLLVRSARSVFLGEHVLDAVTLSPASRAELCLVSLLDLARAVYSSKGRSYRMALCASGVDMITTNYFSWTSLTSRWPMIDIRLCLRWGPPTVEAVRKRIPRRFYLALQGMFVDGTNGENLVDASVCGLYLSTCVALSGLLIAGVLHSYILILSLPSTFSSFSTVETTAIALLQCQCLQCQRSQRCSPPRRTTIIQAIIIRL